jgi:hypothetical protein
MRIFLKVLEDVVLLRTSCRLAFSYLRTAILRKIVLSYTQMLATRSGDGCETETYWSLHCERQSKGILDFFQNEEILSDFLYLASWHKQ